MGQSHSITTWKLPGILAAIAVLVAGSVSAEPLAKEACEALVVEQQALITAGVKADFAKGAEWGKANLKADRLSEVHRYLDVEEQLSFRCGLAKVRFSLPADEETPAPAAVTEEPKTAPNAKPAPKPKAKSKMAAGDDAAPAGRITPAAKVKAKVKPAAGAGGEQSDAAAPAPATPPPAAAPAKE